MPYDEQSFTDGLACGLAATNARPLSPTQKTLLTGSARISSASILNAAFDAFVSRVQIRTDSIVTIVYEYGPADAETLTRDYRKIRASDETQSVYHVCRIAEAVPLRSFRYNVYLLEREDMQIRFDASFTAFPYQSGGQTLEYPGSPEAVDVWLARTAR